MFSPSSKAVYTVSRLNREIRTLLEQGFASLILTGEISNFITPASGHWYFSLKDDKAQIKAAMWRGNNRNQSYRPANGAQVTVKARVSLYEPRGDYQLIVEHMEPAGEGPRDYLAQFTNNHYRKILIVLVLLPQQPALL